jgi:hypothetical protein
LEQKDKNESVVFVVCAWWNLECVGGFGVRGGIWSALVNLECVGGSIESGERRNVNEKQVGKIRPLLPANLRPCGLPSR